MKIVYEKTITEQIRQARRDAEVSGKRIDRVVLTWDEMLRLGQELALLPVGCKSAGAYLPPIPKSVDGVKVALE